MDDAWKAAQARLVAIAESIKSSPSPSTRILRVGQLDSELLDYQLVQLLREPISKALSLVNVRPPLGFESSLIS